MMVRLVIMTGADGDDGDDGNCYAGHACGAMLCIGVKLTDDTETEQRFQSEGHGKKRSLCIRVQLTACGTCPITTSMTTARADAYDR
jgi:hypothetical protein